jgi:hypothetical protein
MAELFHLPDPMDVRRIPVSGDAMNNSGARMANVARIYDYLLGGTENSEADRRAAEQLLDAVPDAAVAAWDNREFLGRAVHYLAKEAGIRQFIDIGTGLPTRGNVHSIAEQVASESRVVYVDYDREVIAHAQALLARHPNVLAVEGDLRKPELLFADSAVRSFINFDEPIAVLLVAVLHFVKDDERPYQAVSALKQMMPRQSYLVLSHVTSDDITAEAARRAEMLYERTTAPGVTRTRADVERFFEGLDLLPPGLVNVAAWRAGWMAANRGRTIFYAGVGVKR